MDTMIDDVRFALRSLAKSKLFTLVALLSLALGIGANVTMFSVVSALVFRPLPYAEPSQLVDLHETSATKLCAGCSVGTSYATFVDWRATARSVTRMIAYTERRFTVSGDEGAERVGGAIISAETFAALGVHPVLGRDFVSDDDRIGAPPVVLLGDALFATRYGSDRRVIGQTIRVNGVAHTVIGVMPPNFRFPERSDLWLPLVPNAGATTRGDRDFGVIGRLAPGVSVEKASAELGAIQTGIAEKNPDSEKEWTAEATPFRFASNDVPVSMYGALLGAVGFVLLIVCANLAGLLLARGTRRQREISIRLALGATRAQIVRHLLTESLLLAVGGGALGLLVAVWGVDLAAKAIGAQAPFYITFGIDARSLVFCAAVSVSTGALFGLLPALRGSRADVHSTLKESSVTVHRSALRGLLVIGELALALILLAGAGLMTKTVLRISAPEQGYDESALLTGSLDFLDAQYRDQTRLASVQQQLDARLSAMPGTASAALDHMEFVAGFGRDDRTIVAEGQRLVSPGVSPRFYHVVTPGYFATVKLPVVSGRGFDARDRAGTERVVMVNQGMAAALWPNTPALGKHIKLGPDDSLPWLTVVGIVGDVRGGDRRGSRARNYAYIPAAQHPAASVTILARASGNDPASLVPHVRDAVRALDRDLPVIDLQTVAQQQRQQYWPYEMYAIAMGTFAAFAILLAGVGLYGVIAYNTAQRTREIGVRMALGADAPRVVGMILGQGGRLVAMGIVAGALGSAALLRVLDSLLFGASSIDLPVYGAVAVLLSLVAFAAIWIPARRAARIDPLTALRAE